MSPNERMALIKQDAPPPRRTKPFALLCVACYQMVKAGYLLLVFAALWSDHQSRLALRETTNDPLVNAPYLYLLPVAATVLLVVGWCIWKLQEWARFAPVFLLVLAFMVWIGARVEVENLPPSYVQSDFLFVAVLVEVLTIAVLYLLPSITEVFQEARAHRA